ncbi:MAG: carbohydrate-binding domain-containing protein [Clostridia bacterium]|nr:carbohydrate-binding domain-containing protein [Clostridia bacterium]
MKNKPFVSAVVAVLIMLCSLSLHAVAEETIDVTALYKNKDIDASWSVSDTEVIDLSALSGDLLILSSKGDYVLSGSFSGQIVVEAPEEDKVRLILNGVTIASPQGPAIYEKQADKLIVTLADGTVNTLTDGPAIAEGDDTIGAALYAEDDLSINGTGTLIAHGTAKHGIQSKADLIIAGGNITVDAVSDGIRGRNSVLILDGSIAVTANGDGIVSTREDQEGKGWVVIAGGSISVTTGDGAGEVKASSKGFGGGRGGFGGWGRGWDESADDDSGVSQKAIKAAADLTILGGSFTFDCADDGLHAANVTVNGGTFFIRSGDDAMHADTQMTVNGGSIEIAQCYEGLEGMNVAVNGGDITIVASDDAVNASGGNDGSGFGGWGRDRFSENDNGGLLSITGGALFVTAGGDGLDSNGSISITGGVIGVWAATSTGEGAIDFNGTGTVNGGTLIVASTGGVMQDTAQLSGQSIMVLSASGTQNGEITLVSASGQTLAAFTPGSSYDTVIVSSDQLQSGDAFTLLCGGNQVYSGAMTDNLSSGGGNGFGGGFGGGFSGGRNRKGR